MYEMVKHDRIANRGRARHRYLSSLSITPIEKITHAIIDSVQLDTSNISTDLLLGSDVSTSSRFEIQKVEDRQPVNELSNDDTIDSVRSCPSDDLEYRGNRRHALTNVCDAKTNEEDNTEDEEPSQINHRIDSWRCSRRYPTATTTTTSDVSSQKRKTRMVNCFSKKGGYQNEEIVSSKKDTDATINGDTNNCDIKLEVGRKSSFTSSPQAGDKFDQDATRKDNIKPENKKNVDTTGKTDTIKQISSIKPSVESYELNTLVGPCTYASKFKIVPTFGGESVKMRAKSERKSLAPLNSSLSENNEDLAHIQSNNLVRRGCPHFSYRNISQPSTPVETCKTQEKEAVVASQEKKCLLIKNKGLPNISIPSPSESNPDSGIDSNRSTPSVMERVQKYFSKINDNGSRVCAEGIDVCYVATTPRKVARKSNNLSNTQLIDHSNEVVIDLRINSMGEISKESTAFKTSDDQNDSNGSPQIDANFAVDDTSKINYIGTASTSKLVSSESNNVPVVTSYRKSHNLTTRVEQQVKERIQSLNLSVGNKEGVEAPINNCRLNNKKSKQKELNLFNESDVLDRVRRYQKESNGSLRLQADANFAVDDTSKINYIGTASTSKLVSSESNNIPVVTSYRKSHNLTTRVEQQVKERIQSLNLSVGNEEGVEAPINNCQSNNTNSKQKELNLLNPSDVLDRVRRYQIKNKSSNARTSSTSKNNDAPNLFLDMSDMCSSISNFDENERIPLTLASPVQNLRQIQLSPKKKCDKIVSDLLNEHLICNNNNRHFYERKKLVHNERIGLKENDNTDNLNQPSYSQPNTFHANDTSSNQQGRMIQQQNELFASNMIKMEMRMEQHLLQLEERLKLQFRMDLEQMNVTIDDKLELLKEYIKNDDIAMKILR